MGHWTLQTRNSVYRVLTVVDRGGLSDMEQMNIEEPIG